jgi:molybdopterin converting factor subunit 1
MPPGERSGSEPSSGGFVRLLAFAAVRDLLGFAEGTLEIDAPCSASTLWSLLVSRYPALAPHRGAVRLAINGTYAFDEDPIAPGDEVALLPPVSGG